MDSVQRGNAPRPERNKTFLQFMKNLRHGPKSILETWLEELSFRVEVLAIPFIAALLAWRHCSPDQWFWVMQGCAFVLAAELLNTSRENELRISQPTKQVLLLTDGRRHRLVRRAFDCAAGMVTIGLAYTTAVLIYVLVCPG